MKGPELNEREQHVLRAVIRTYVDTAEPAESRTVARRFRLGISPATVRNTMSDLEEKGYLRHPHTSAGRVPTDLAYRMYVDSLLGQPRPPTPEQLALRQELEASGDRAAVEGLVRHAAQILGLVTQELEIAIAPRWDEATLERLDLLPLAEGKVLFVLHLRAGGVRTVYVDVPANLPSSTIFTVGRVLNERLAGSSLREIRSTVARRLRDTVASDDPSAHLLNVFIESADEWLDLGTARGSDLHLGKASVLAEQPEFSSGERLRGLIELLERRDLLESVLGERLAAKGLQITIGEEHGDAALTPFTVVTSEYRVGDLRGVIGVIGPTRMPYDKVIALVDSTSALVSEFLA